MTPATLTARQNAIFDMLEADRRLAGRLYRDGVPSPEVYLAQAFKVIFVFREPNLGGQHRRHDMRLEVRDPHFRPLISGERIERTSHCWWNAKAGMFAHAVAAAIDGEPSRSALRRFRPGDWHHDVVNRFGYLQIKKTGGAGQSVAGEIRSHAAIWAHALRGQLDVYAPDLVIGCGTGGHGPAQLLAEHVLTGGTREETRRTTAVWWRFDVGRRPKAMLQAWHPSIRKERSEVYRDLYASVREVMAHLT